MHFRFSIFIVFLCLSTLNGQNATLDSLQQKLATAQTVKDSIESNIAIAQLYRKLNLDSVKKYGQAALRQSQNSGNKELQVESYFALASGYGNQYITEITDTVWMYIDSAENLSNKLNYQKGLAEAQYFKGSVNLTQNNFGESAKYFIRADEMFTALEDSQKLAEVKQSIGYYYIVVEEYEKALPYILESKDLFERLKQYENQIYSLNNIAAIYFYLDDTVQTIKTIKECYAISMKHGQLDDKIRACESIASQFILSNNLDSAEYYYKEAIRLANFPDGERHLDLTYRNLSVIYNKRKDFKQEEKYLLKALEIARKTGQANRELAYIYDLSTFYDSVNNYKKSLSYLKEYTALRDSLKLSDAGFILDKALSDKELEVRINELNELRTERASMINKKVVLPVLCLIALLLFLSLWYYQNRLLYQLKKSILRTCNQKAAPRFWQSDSEKQAIPGKYRLLASLIFTILTIVLMNVFYQSISWGFLSLAGSFVLMILFYFSHRAMELLGRRTANTFRNELLQVLLFFIAVSLISAGVSGVLFLMEMVPESVVFSFICALIALSVTQLFLHLLKYQVSHDRLFNTLVTELNKVLIRKEEKRSKDQHAAMIQIEDNEIVLDSIIYIVSENVYQEIICRENGRLDKKLVRKTLSVLEQELENYPNFIRCHRSYIINLSKVVSVTGNSRQQFFIVEGSKERVPISRSLANTILTHFEELVN